MERNNVFLYIILAIAIIFNNNFLLSYVAPPDYYPPLCSIGGCEKITEPFNKHLVYKLKNCPNCNIHLWYSIWKENCNGIEIDVVYPYGLWYYSHQACVNECSGGNFDVFNFQAMKEVLLHDPELWPENGRTKMVRITRASCWYNGGTGTNDEMWLICQYPQRCCYDAYYVTNDNGIITIQNAEVSGPSNELCPPDGNNNYCQVFCNYNEPSQKITVDLNNFGVIENNFIKIITSFDEMERMILSYTKIWNTISISIYDFEGKLFYSGDLNNNYQSKLQKNGIYVIMFYCNDGIIRNVNFIIEE